MLVDVDHSWANRGAQRSSWSFGLFWEESRWAGRRARSLPIVNADSRRRRSSYSSCITMCSFLPSAAVLLATVPLGHGRQWDKNSTRSRQEERGRDKNPKFETVLRRRRLMKPHAGIFPRRGGKRARNCSVARLKIRFAGRSFMSVSCPHSLAVTGRIYRSEMGNYNHVTLSWCPRVLQALRVGKFPPRSHVFVLRSSRRE